MQSFICLCLLSTSLLSTCVTSLPQSLTVISDVNFDLQSLGSSESRDPEEPRSAHLNPFRHPGLLHTTSDFERIKRQKNGGWAASRAYRQFVTERHSRSDWKLLGPYRRIHRDHAEDSGSVLAFTQDSEAARQLALLWAIDGNEKAGRKAVEILEKWGSTLKKADGTGAQLFASLSGSILIQAAEIMRYTSNLWDSASIAQFENMVRTVLLPPIIQSRKNTELPFPFSGNWGTSAEKGMIAIAIFTDDHELYNTAKNAILYSPCANVTGIISPTGQSSDSGRDQQHTQLGLGSFAESFQMLWNQGDDFYSYGNNRLLTGLEYTAQYLSGNEVPYDPKFVTCHCNIVGGPWKSISPNGRDRVRPIFEMAYAHYTLVKGLQMPWTQKLIKRHTPDGAAPDGSATDQSSFQTLLFRDQRSTELNTA